MFFSYANATVAGLMFNAVGCHEHLSVALFQFLEWAALKFSVESSKIIYSESLIWLKVLREG